MPVVLFRGRAAPLLTALALASLATSAAAQDDLRTAIKAASCNACHGPDGRSEAGIPPLAGRPADQLFAMLTQFKGGQRAAYVMHHHTRGYTDEELRNIAGWFARLPAQEARR
jgi:cytochrome c553